MPYNKLFKIINYNINIIKYNIIINLINQDYIRMFIKMSMKKKINSIDNSNNKKNKQSKENKKSKKNKTQYSMKSINILLNGELDEYTITIY